MKNRVFLWILFTITLSMLIIVSAGLVYFYPGRVRERQVYTLSDSNRVNVTIIPQSPAALEREDTRDAVVIQDIDEPDQSEDAEYEIIEPEGEPQPEPATVTPVDPGDESISNERYGTTEYYEEFAEEELPVPEGQESLAVADAETIPADAGQENTAVPEDGAESGEEDKPESLFSSIFGRIGGEIENSLIGDSARGLINEAVDAVEEMSEPTVETVTEDAGEVEAAVNEIADFVETLPVDDVVENVRDGLFGRIADALKTHASEEPAVEDTGEPPIEAEAIIPDPEPVVETGDLSESVEIPESQPVEIAVGTETESEEGLDIPEPVVEPEPEAKVAAESGAAPVDDAADSQESVFPATIPEETTTTDGDREADEDIPIVVSSPEIFTEPEPGTEVGTGTEAEAGIAVKSAPEEDPEPDISRPVNLPVISGAVDEGAVVPGDPEPEEPEPEVIAAAAEESAREEVVAEQPVPEDEPAYAEETIQAAEQEPEEELIQDSMVKPVIEPRYWVTAGLFDSINAAETELYFLNRNGLNAMISVEDSDTFILKLGPFGTVQQAQDYAGVVNSINRFSGKASVSITIPRSWESGNDS